MLIENRNVPGECLLCRGSFGCGVGIGSVRQRNNHICVTLVAIKVCRVVAGKGAAAVVTLQAVESWSRPVFEGRDAVYLLPLAVARLHFVAFIAAFASVVFVAENDLWTILRRQRPHVICELMTNVAGIVFILCLMASVTSCMGLETSGNGFAASRRLMASGAAFGRLTGAAIVISMIEYGIEPLIELHGKCFDRRVLCSQI